MVNEGIIICDFSWHVGYSVLKLFYRIGGRCSWYDPATASGWEPVEKCRLSEIYQVKGPPIHDPLE